MTGVPRIRAATAADLPSVLALLRARELPVDGIGPPLTGFVVADLDGQVVGVAGLEAYGAAGLLRSVAVRADGQGGGTGRRLVARVLTDARETGMRDVYLLTTTAAGYFPRLGFRPVPRSTVPRAVRDSVEFREACPASAVAMHRAVGDPPGAGR